MTTGEGTPAAGEATTGEAVAPAPNGVPCFGDLAAFFELLSHPLRLRVVLLLRDGPRHVDNLCNALGAPQPTVSHHLNCLRLAGVVTGRRRGKFRDYALGPHASVGEDGAVDFALPGWRVRVTSAPSPP